MTLARDPLDKADAYLGNHVPEDYAIRTYGPAQPASRETGDGHAQALAMVDMARSMRTITTLLEQIQSTLHGLAQRP